MLDIVVFASGRGSNFAALLEAQQREELPIRIRALLSDKPNAPALEVARRANVPAHALSPRDYLDRASFDRAIFARAQEFSPDLIVLTGYMRVIDDAVIARWVGKVINIHPSLLPKYPGLNTHQRALDAGDSTHGASVHFVTPELDGGPVIAQVELSIHSDDAALTLAARLLQREHRLLVATVALLAQRRITFDGSSVEFDSHPLRSPLHLTGQNILESR